jgi:hypothetical protein
MVGACAHRNIKGSPIIKNPLNVHPNGSKRWVQPALNKYTLGRDLRVLLLHLIAPASSGAERAKKGPTGTNYFSFKTFIFQIYLFLWTLKIYMICGTHWMILVINISENCIYILNLVNHDVSGLQILNVLNT